MTAYSEKLKDSRWQRKRLEIMTRDRWMCQSCGATEHNRASVSFNVHHKRYEFGKEPWEASDIDLITLCDKCHERETRMRPAVRAATTASLNSLLYEDANWLHALILGICVAKTLDASFNVRAVVCGLIDTLPVEQQLKVILKERAWPHVSDWV